MTQNRHDIAAEYNSNIIIEEGYDMERHCNEVKTAVWLQLNYGGKIILINDLKDQSHYSPDYIWQDRMWELKNPTTEAAANSALKKGIKWKHYNTIIKIWVVVKDELVIEWEY